MEAVKRQMASVRDLDFSPEWEFRTSRSGGKGGQNVNKVESRVELFWNVQNSSLLTDEQKGRISQRLANRINRERFLYLASEEDRSQLRNREKVIDKFYDLLDNALKEQKKRKRTRPSRSSIENRLKHKRIHAEKKANRRWEG